MTPVSSYAARAVPSSGEALAPTGETIVARSGNKGAGRLISPSIRGSLLGVAEGAGSTPAKLPLELGLAQVDHRGSAMGASVGKGGVLELSDQVALFVEREGLASSHGGVAGKGDEDLILP